MSLNLYLWLEWSYVGDNPKALQQAWLITTQVSGSSSAGNVTWRAEAYANCLDHDLEDRGTWSGYAEKYVSYGRALSGTDLDPQATSSPEWETLYLDVVAACRDFGLSTYRWDALLNGTVMERPPDISAALAWVYQSIEAFSAGDVFPLISIDYEGQTATVYKLTANRVLSIAGFAWDGKAWTVEGQ